MADYARVSLFDVQMMDILCYLQLRRDAYIHALQQTKEGREYLNDAWRLEQIEPERDKLRKKNGVKG